MSADPKRTLGHPLTKSGEAMRRREFITLIGGGGRHVVDRCARAAANNAGRRLLQCRVA